MALFFNFPGFIREYTLSCISLTPTNQLRIFSALYNSNASKTTPQESAVPVKMLYLPDLSQCHAGSEAGTRCETRLIQTDFERLAELCWRNVNSWIPDLDNMFHNTSRDAGATLFRELTELIGSCVCGAHQDQVPSIVFQWVHEFIHDADVPAGAEYRFGRGAIGPDLHGDLVRLVGPIGDLLPIEPPTRSEPSLNGPVFQITEDGIQPVEVEVRYDEDLLGRYFDSLERSSELTDEAVHPAVEESSEGSAHTRVPSTIVYVLINIPPSPLREPNLGPFTCPICREDEEEGTPRVCCRGHCGAAFHEECIDGWIVELTIQDAAINCPMCRIEHYGFSRHFDSSDQD